MKPDYSLTQVDSFHKCSFQAMASPCEILFRTDSVALPDFFSEQVVKETRRIEQKFSRYLANNIIHEINNANGRKIKVDDETSRLIDFAESCYKLSEGMFDITSGLLRKCWKFDGKEQLPDQRKISRLLKLIGWNKVKWTPPRLTLNPGMEIDLGGIGKEYAVDRAANIALENDITKVMINFGGDIRVISPFDDNQPWVIGIEDPKLQNSAIGEITIHNGAIATSGGAMRYCYFKGRRLSHILNPKTGWPVEKAFKSVTVIAENCIQAGMLATMAILSGENAEDFLKKQNVVFKCVKE